MAHKLEKYGPYLYILPALLIVFCVIVYPTLALLWGSVTSTDGSSVQFVGLQNFISAFEDPLFQTAILNNLKLFLMVPILTILSLIISTLLFNKIKGWKFYRAIVFFPYILSISVVGIVFSYILQYNGIINTVLRSIGMDWAALDWLGNPELAMGTVCAVVVWKQLGFGVVVLLARMLSIDVSLYESAELDGASEYRKLVNITIPQARSIIEFYVVITLIEMLSWVFSYVFVMTSGGPGGSTYILEYLIYKKAFGGGNYNIAQAISVVILLIAAVIIAVQQLLMHKGDDENE